MGQSVRRIIVPLLVVLIVPCKAIFFTCSNSWAGLEPCFQPLALLSTGLGMGLMQQRMGASGRSGNLEDIISEPIAQTVCQTTQIATKCAAEYLKTCYPQEQAAIQPLVDGTAKLMEVCHHKDFYQQGKILANCVDQLNQHSPNLLECSQTAVQASVPYLEHRGSSGVAAIKAIRSGVIMKDICNFVKQAYGCQLPEIRRCPPEAATVYRKIYDAILDAYSCNTPVTKKPETAPGKAAGSTSGAENIVAKGITATSIIISTLILLV